MKEAIDQVHRVSFAKGMGWWSLQRALLILLKLLTRRLSVILERLGQVGIIQISTLVHYQRGGSRPRAGGGQRTGTARANARSSSGSEQGGGGSFRGEDRRKSPCLTS